MKGKKLRLAMMEVLLEMEDILESAKTPIIDPGPEEKWVARLILDLRKHYIHNCGRSPTHVFLPPEYLEKLLLELPPGCLDSTSMDEDGLHRFVRIYGMKVVSKFSNDELSSRFHSLVNQRPFAMWEQLFNA